jgi:Domain of unknown function (DUF4132)
MAKTAQELFQEYHDTIFAKQYFFEDLFTMDPIRQLMESPGSVQKEFLLIIFENLDKKLGSFETLSEAFKFNESLPGGEQNSLMSSVDLAKKLLLKKLPLSEDDYVFITEHVLKLTFYEYGILGDNIISDLINNLKKYFEREEKEAWPELKTAFVRYLELGETWPFAGDMVYAHDRKIIAKAKKLLSGSQSNTLSSGEAWSDVAIADMSALNKQQKSEWESLFRHCLELSSGKPRVKWLKAADPLVKAIQEENFKKYVLKWFRLIDHPRNKPVENSNPWEMDPDLIIDADNSEIIRGLVYCCSMFENVEVVRAVAEVCSAVYKKIPGFGPRSGKIGNACVWTLSKIADDESVGQLSYLKSTIKHKVALKAIEKAYDAVSEKLGVSRDDVEEMGIPDYGMTGIGLLEEKIGDFQAKFTAQGGRSTKLVWIKSDGKEQKSVPADVKKDHAKELKDLKARIAKIKKMISSQKDWLNNIFLEQKSWDYPTWKKDTWIIPSQEFFSGN